MGLWSGLAEAAAESLSALRGVRTLKEARCQRIFLGEWGSRKDGGRGRRGGRGGAFETRMTRRGAKGTKGGNGDRGEREGAEGAEGRLNHE